VGPGWCTVLVSHIYQLELDTAFTCVVDTPGIDTVIFPGIARR
jgi:hypothetical protein